MVCFFNGGCAIAVPGGNQGGCPFRYSEAIIKAALMRRTLYVVPFLALLCCAMPLSAQVSTGYDPYRLTPEKRKAARDAVCQRVGEGSAAFTRKYGDPGIAALQKCSTEIGQRLVALDAQGGMQGKIADPKRLLELIARYGDLVTDWAVSNAALLADPVAFDLFVREPRDYVYDLRDLSADTAAAKQANGLAGTPAQAGATPPLPAWAGPALICGAVIAAIFAGRAWGKRTLG
jgi:hypothetical protein